MQTLEEIENSVNIISIKKLEQIMQSSKQDGAKYPV